ncbi:MAG: hypothetical protein C0403_11740 [Desulfobacterium sp.]|nr:hypothetical protein [Desulfobacterium sp.]
MDGIQISFIPHEPISKVCCCSSGESRNPVFSVLFWTSAFAGVMLFNRFEIGLNDFNKEGGAMIDAAPPLFTHSHVS